MKRIIVLLFAVLQISSVLAGQSGFIKPIVQPITAATDLKNIKLDFEKLAKNGEIKSNQLLVKFKSNQQQPSSSSMNTQSIKQIRSFYNPTKKLAQSAQMLSQWKVVSFEKGENINEMFSMLKNDQNVEYVVPNIKLKVQATTPNDLQTELWGLSNTGASFQFENKDNQTITVDTIANVDIDAPEAWDIRTDASNVIVAVIDTGIDYTHPELANNIWTNPGEIAGNGVDDDGNGYIDDIHGYDFVNRDGDPMDDHGHGTHCSGTIAAAGNNNQGVVGVTWSTQLMGIKILGADGYGYTSDIIEGILYAADNGATISNNSYGRLISDALYAQMALAPYRDAIAAVNDSGMLFVAAAGNEYTNLDEEYFAVPASLNVPNIISVAAVDAKGELAEFSNRGYHHTDIAAPGVYIKSTLPGNQYALWSGTSMATPHVVGVAALMKAEAVNLDPAAIKSILLKTAEPSSQLVGKVRSEGLLNAKNALDALKTSCSTFTATPPQHRDAGRAHTCNSWYICANGSDTQIGYSFTTSNITLTEKTSGYFVTDGSCNASLDIPPTITLKGEVEEYVRVGEIYASQGATAIDVEDGNISAKISIEGSVNTSVIGNYLLKYRVTDSAGNNIVETRLIHVLDDSQPHIELLGPVCSFMDVCSPLMHIVDEPYQDPGYFAWDVLDGDISDRVTYSGDILDNLDIIGNKGTIFYEVSDTDGNSGRTGYFRYLYVMHQDNPLFIADNTEPYYSVFRTYRRDETEGHPIYNPYAPGAIDYVDGELPAEQITTDDPTNYAIAGDYEVVFTVIDSEGFTDHAYSLVQVIEDVTPPEARLYCEENISVELNSDIQIKETCAYPVDDLDPKPQREVTGFVDLATEGDYEVVYRLWDASGNETIWIQTVTVIDGSTPQLTSKLAIPGPRTVTISGTAYDANNDIEKVEVRLHTNMTDWIVADGTNDWSVTLDDIDPANYVAFVRITDSSGLQTYPYDSVNTIRNILVWDSKIESIDVAIDGSNALVSGFASDANGDLDRVEISISSDNSTTTGIVAQGTYDWLYQFTDLAKGDYRVYAYAIDAKGNWSQREDLEFSIGMNAPVIESLEAHGSEASIQISGTAKDVDDDIYYIEVELDGNGNWYNTSGKEVFAVTIAKLAAGTHKVRARAVDNEGNVSQIYGPITAVVTAPACKDYSATVAQHESAGRAYSTTKTVGQTCYGTFCFGGTEQTTWFATGSAENLGTDGGTVISLKESPADSGDYVKGECPADPQPPVIISTNVSVVIDDVIITGTAQDPDNDIVASVIYFQGGGFECEGTTNFTCRISGLPAGNYQAAVKVIDSGMRDSELVYVDFTITNPMPPQVVIDKVEVIGTTLKVTGTTSDVNNDVTRVTMALPGPLSINCTGTQTYVCQADISGYDAGAWGGHIYAVDAVKQISNNVLFDFVVEEQLGCFTDTNTNHEAAGRATLKYNVLFYANGSENYLGQSADTTSIEQTAPGNWTKVTSCP